MGFLKMPNLFGGLTNAINKALDQQFQSQDDEDDPGPSSSLVPAQGPQTPAAPTQSGGDDVEPETTIVSGKFIPDTAHQSASDLYSESTRQTERFRRMVEQFDEDKQEPVEWLIRKGASLFCYVAPFVLAVPIGLAVGDAFTLPDMTPIMSLAIHLLSIFIEVLMPILGLATTLVFRRMLKDRSKIMSFIAVALFFLAVSSLNSVALLFLLEQGMELWADPAATVGVIGRSFGPLIIDVGCTIYLSVASVKSLQKYLADQRQKIVAIRDVNQVNIELEQTQIQAAINRQTSVMDMQSKQQRAQTWNEIEKMQSQAMIEQARRSLQGGGNGPQRSLW